MLILSFITTLFSNPPEYDVVEQARQKVAQNFTYTGYRDEIDWNETGDKPFSGDCKSFSVAVMNQLKASGKKPTLNIVRLEDKRSHMIVCLGDYCADNLNDKAVKRSELPYKFEIEVPL